MKLKGIRRVNKFTDPELLGEDEVTRLENLILDGGIAKKRGGIQSYNTAPTGGNLDQLFELDGYIYGRVGTSLKKLSGTWSSSIKTVADTNLQFGRFSGMGIFTNGTNLFTVEDGTAYDFVITRPDVDGVTLTSSSPTPSGELNSGQEYKYVMAYMLDDGTLSDFSNEFSKILSGDTLTLGSLPVSSDARVERKKIYRTKGNSDTFYLLTTLLNSATTYTDKVSDDDLDISESPNYLAQMTIASALCMHKDRLILGDVTLTETSNYGNWEVTATSGASGSLSGTYRYGISFTMGDGTETDILFTSKEITLTSEGCYVGYGVRGEANADIASVNLYRSFYSGSWGSYYLVGSYTELANLVTDNNSSLTTAHSTPDYTGIVKPSRIYFSDVNKPLQIPELNYIDIYPDDDEEIVGLVDQEDGILVLKEKSICFVYTSGSPYNWRVVKLVENVGCTDSNSIQRAKNAIYFKYQDDIYRYPDMKIVSLEFKDALDGVSIQGTTYVSKYNWYVIVGSSWFYIYDEKNDTWLHFIPSSGTFYSALETIDGVFLIGSEILLYYDPSETLDYDSGSNDADISSTLRSKTFVTGTPNQGFRLRKIYSNYQAGGSVTQSLTDPDSGDSKSVTRSDSGWVEYRGITDSLTGDLKTSHKLYYQISGDIQQFSGMELEGIMRHRRRTWS